MNEKLTALLLAFKSNRFMVMEKDGEYKAALPQNFDQDKRDGWEDKEMEGRLCFELFGEYPLSTGAAEQWKKIRSVFYTQSGIRNISEE